MTYEYDSQANALYIKLREQLIIDRQIETIDGIIIDVTNRNEPIGIEILSHNAGWSIASIEDCVSLLSEEKKYIESINKYFYDQKTFSSTFTVESENKSNTSFVTIEA